MDIELIALDLDIRLGFCHSFRLGILELFHDHHIVVIDTVGDIDETVVGSRVIFMLCNSMVLIIYVIVDVTLLMAKGYNTPFFIRCTRRIDDRSRRLVADSNTIRHRDRGLSASC